MAEMVLPWMSIVAIVMSHPTIVATRATRSRLGVDVVVAVLASDMVDGPCQGSGLAGAGTLVSPTLPGGFPHRAENLPNSLRVTDPARNCVFQPHLQTLSSLSLVAVNRFCGY